MKFQNSGRWPDPFADVKFNHVHDPNGNPIPGQVGVYLYDKSMEGKQFPYRLIKMVSDSYNLITNATAKEAGMAIMKKTELQWRPNFVHVTKKDSQNPRSHWFNGYIYLQDYCTPIKEGWDLGFRIRNSYDGKMNLSFECYLWNEKARCVIYDSEKFGPRKIKHVVGQLIDPDEEAEKVMGYFWVAKELIDQLEKYHHVPLQVNTMMNLFRNRVIVLPKTTYSTAIVNIPAKDPSLADFFYAVCHALTFGNRVNEAALRKVFTWLKRQPTQI